MDDYKKSIIEFVRGYPIIWDPTNKDYKNREQRKQVWEEINSQLQSPTGSNTHAKETWEHMTRSFSNALKRKDKRSGSGAGSDKEWKFEKDMMFLLPVKQLRNTSGNMPDTDLSDDHIHSHFDDSQVSPRSQENTQDDNAQPDILPVTNTNTSGQTVENACRQQSKRKQPCMDDDTNDIIQLIKQRQLEKSNDSPRLNFFRSMMPIIDSFSDDQFMNLQMDFIQSVQRQKNAHNFAYAHQYQYQAPTHSSDGSADSYRTSTPYSYFHDQSN